MDQNYRFFTGTILKNFEQSLRTGNAELFTETESGEGRFDIQLEPIDKKQMGYIIEFKEGKECTGEQLDKLATEAVRYEQVPR